MDVGYVNNNYISLTKPQEIIGELEINGNVLFRGDIKTGSVHVNGMIRDSLR